MLGGADFETWYRREHPRLLGALTVAAGSPDVAADATAEAFVRAYERWDRVRDMASPGGWLYRVALNVVRRRARRLAFEHDVLRRSVPVAEPPPLVHPEVWDAVRALPRQQRVAIALRYVLDLPEAEVAAVMGVTRGSASATLTAARRRLADDLAWTDQDLERIGNG
jgi:RNA polymerase sigma-70 factor, ECF subfamily